MRKQTWLKVTRTPRTNNSLQAAALTAFWKFLTMLNVQAVAEQVPSCLSQPIHLEQDSLQPQRDQPGQKSRDYSWRQKASGFQSNHFSLTDRWYPCYQNGQNFSFDLNLYEINVGNYFKQIIHFAYICLLWMLAHVRKKECCLNKWHHCPFQSDIQPHSDT